LNRFFRRSCALALALCLLLSSAAAELSWADEPLSALLGANRDTAFSLTFQLGQLQPFGEETLAMLNETLQHIQVESRIRADGTQTAFCVDGESLFAVEEMQQDGRQMLSTDLLPNRLLLSDASPMDLLSGNQAAQEEPFELYRAIGEVESCWQELTDAIVPYATEKEANYKISGIGYARWVRLAKLSEADSTLLLPWIVKVLACGMDQPFREKLQSLTCGDGFTIALYSDKENGAPLALYMRGNVYLNPEEKWTLAWQWAFSEEDGQRKDTWRYELEAVKAPRHKRIIEAERVIAESDAGISLTRECQLTLKDEERHQVITNDDTLTAVKTDDRVELSGTLETTVKVYSGEDSVTTVTTVTPALALTSAQGSGVLSGTVLLEETRSKKLLTAVTFVFAQEPAQALEAAEQDGSLFAVADAAPADASLAGSSLAQNVDVDWADPTGYLVGNPPIGMTAYSAPATLQNIDLDLADDAAKAALLEEMAQNAAGKLLVSLASLPGEPLTLLSDNMTAEDYQAFLSLLGDL